MIARVSGVVVLCVLAGGPAGAQPAAGHGEPAAPVLVDGLHGLTLAQAIERALEQAPVLRAARADVEAARGLRRQAAAAANPMLTVVRQEEPRGADTETRIDLQWPLELRRRAARAGVAGRDLEVAEREADGRAWDLAARVRQAYGEVAWAARMLALSAEVNETAARQLALAAARVEEGAAPRLERDILQVELRRLQADRLLLAAEAHRRLLELKQLLGLPPEAPLAIAHDLETLAGTPPPAAPALPGGTDHRPDVREQAARLEAADARIVQARREGLVDVTLFGSYMRTYAGFPQLGVGDGGGLEPVRGRFHYLAAGATLTLPIRHRNQGGVAAAMAGRDAAAARLEAAQLGARSEAAAARERDAGAARALALYGTENRNLARRNLDVVLQAYQLGRMTVADALAEQRRYLEFERGYAAALREAYDARQALAAALGVVR